MIYFCIYLAQLNRKALNQILPLGYHLYKSAIEINVNSSFYIWNIGA